MKLTKKDKRTLLEKEIDHQVVVLTSLSPLDVEAYKKQLDIVERLYALKEEIPKERINWNTVLTVGGSLLGIGIILTYEQLGHVISTKALGFVLKGRV